MARICCATTTKAKSAELKLYAPKAKKVYLAGTFNNWNTKDTPAKKDLQGNWKVKINLDPGRYEYKFFVDGNWVNDPNCKGCITNAFGSNNCVIEIK